MSDSASTSANSSAVVRFFVEQGPLADREFAFDGYELFLVGRSRETASGQWALGGSRLPFGVELQNRFPLVGRFLDERGESKVSGLLPEQVAAVLASVFD